MAQTINIQRLWDQKYTDESRPFPIDGTPDGFNLADGSVAGAKIADGAVTSAKIADGTIADGDISASAAIAASKLAAGTDGQVLTSNGGVAEWGSAGSSGGAAGGDLIGTYPNPTLAPHVVNTSNLVSGAVTDNEISGSAAINPAKLAPSATSGFVLTTLGSSVAWAAASGGAASSASALRWFDTKDYGAKCDIKHPGGVAVTASNTTIASAAFSGTATDSGKLICLRAAGALLFSGTDGVMTTGTAATNNRFTSAGSSFTSAVIGRWLVVDRSPVFMARIIGVESATQLRLATPAPASFTGQTWRIAEDHYTTIASSIAGVSAVLANAPITSVASSDCWYGTDDAVAIQAAVTACEAAAGNGGVVYHYGASAIGTAIFLQKATQFIGAGSRGYGRVLALGTSRLHLLKPGIRGLVGGPSASGMGVNGAMTSGQAILVDPSANFQAGDVNKNIIVYGAGTQTGSTDGVFLNTTIASRQSATQVTLSANAGTTITGAIYSYTTNAGYNNGLVGPSVRNLHIVGGPGQLAGVHLMNCSESIVDEVACSDFGSGVAHFIDPGPSVGFTNQCEMRSVYAIDSRIGIKSDRGTLFATGNGFIDGNSNRVDCNVPAGLTIGVDVDDFVQGGFMKIQAVGTGVKGAGRGNPGSVAGDGWAFENVGVAFDLASDGTGGLNHRVAYSSMGNSNAGGANGLKLRAGAKATLRRGFSLDADIDMFGLVDSTATLVVLGERIQKAGSVTDADFTNQPYDGAQGVDTSTGDLYTRVSGNWRRVASSSVASRVRRLDIKAPGTATTSQILTVPNGKVAVGHHVIVAVAYGQASTRTVTVTDSKGNTYQQDAAADLTTGQTPHALIFSSHITTQLVGLDTITVTFSGSVNIPICGAYEYAGLASSSWLDQTATATGTSTSPSSGSITTTAASEVIVGVICNGGGVTLATVTAEAGWSEADNVQTVGAKNIEVEDLIVFSTGAHAATATLSTSNDWAAVVASYKAA